MTEHGAHTDTHIHKHTHRHTDKHTHTYTNTHRHTHTQRGSHKMTFSWGNEKPLKETAEPKLVTSVLPEAPDGQGDDRAV